MMCKSTEYATEYLMLIDITTNNRISTDFQNTQKYILWL